MKTTMRKGVRLGLAAGLAVTGLVGVTSLTASGQPASQSAGKIVVDAVAPPDGTGKLLATVEYRDAANNLVATQTISANGPCDTLLDEGPRILSIGTTPPNSRPVLVNDGLGILSGNQNCGAEGVIDRSEILNLALGTYFDDLALFDTDVYVSATTLEVLRSGSPARLAVTRDTNATEERTVTEGIVDAEAFGGWDQRLLVSSTANRFNRGIVLVGATFTLERAVANQAPTASFTWDPTTLTVDFLDGSSDPDGTVEGWEWDFGDPNSTTDTSAVQNPVYTYSEAGKYQVTLAVTDNLGRKSSAFTAEVTVTGTAVFCSREVGDGTTSDVATANFLRGENGNKFTDPCADVGVIVDVVNSDSAFPEGYVFFDNSFKGVDGSDQDVNGLVTIKWQSIDPAVPAEVARMNNRLIDYDGFEPGIGPKPQSYCLSFDQTIGLDEFGEEIFTFNVLLPDWPWGDAPGFILVDGVKKVPWCLVSDTRVVDEFGDIIQTEVLFGRGDPIKPK